MTNKEFNKADFEREMKAKYSKRDIMIKGRKVNFETNIKNYPLYELMYGDKIKEPQDSYSGVWEDFRRYNG